MNASQQSRESAALGGQSQVCPRVADLLVLPQGLELRHDEQGLTLVGDGLELRGDFARMLPRLRQPNLSRELLVRAARVKGVPDPLVVDATAGLGEDSMLLAAAGCTVILCERDPVIAALLRDALERAADDCRLSRIVSRMRLEEGDGAITLRSLERVPDVVYLDPMFPERRKRGATNKKLQLFQRLERPCEDERALMDAALAARPRKVVVKRPLKGPHLGGVKPSSSLTGNVVRYDIVIPPSI